MPFILAAIGLAMVVIAVRGTEGEATALLKSEVANGAGFVEFAAALALLGAIGYVRTLRPIADGFAGLVLLVMIVVNKGVFTAFNQQIRNPVAVNPPQSGSVKPDYGGEPTIGGIIPTNDPYLPTYKPPVA